MTKLYDDSQGHYIKFAQEGNTTIHLDVSVNAKEGTPLGYTEWFVSPEIDDAIVKSKQEQAPGGELKRFTRSGELPNNNPKRQEALTAAAKAMDEVKKQIDTDPEMQTLGVRVNRFGVRPNEFVGKILQEKFGYKHLEGNTSSPEGNPNPLDEFLRT